ncbi:hypothetical protein B5S28_g4536 [[Candida] boidinii]|nr:hypothetical protein B5S28_g4536 [[Candida] boidinii]OWB60131.1 hypothetical protein B5S29_g999 [[Candida] boidinii]
MSRLDRLVILLETGSTQFIRNTAANQLADLAKQHPDDALNLLSRVYPFLLSKKWETRVSASKAFGGIISNYPKWDPNSDENDNDSNDTTTTTVNSSTDSIIPSIIKQESSEENVPISIVKEEAKSDEEALKQLIDNDSHNFVGFDDWSLAEILQCGKVLLASSGQEYNSFTNTDTPNNTDKNEEFNIKRRKTEFILKYGLNEVKNEIKSEDSSNIPKKEEDSKIKIPSSSSSTSPPPSHSNNNGGGNSPQPTSSDNTESKGTSARMRAMAKRKAKFSRSNSSKQSQVDLSQSSVSRQLANETSNIKSESDSTNGNNDNNNNSSTDIDITSQNNGSKLVIEHKIHEVSPLLKKNEKFANWVWPFQGVFELLLQNLFDDVWEVRHGSAMGLREIIKHHAKGAGRVKGKTRSENDLRNKKTLEDLCVRLITLFAMDRFGDYVSDTVIAPVRENSAQTLSALLLHLPEDVVLKAFNALTKLVKQDIGELGIKVSCWEAKHGGMLGLRYFVTIRTDLLFSHPELLDTTINIVLFSLNESDDDDVQSVAASTLIPIASEFVKLKLDLALQMVNVIWIVLSDLKDDLSASIGSVMDLLARLCSHKEVLDKMKEYTLTDENYDLKQLIPRLYPFLRHSISNVRKSVLKTLLAFLNIEGDSFKTWIDGKIFRLLFQNLLVEQNTDVLNLSTLVYNELLNEIKKEKLGLMDDIFKNHDTQLLTLLMTPIGLPRFNYSMNTNLILRPSGQSLTDIQLTGLNVSNDNTKQQRGRKRKQNSSSDNSNNTNNKDKDSSNMNNGIPQSEYDLKINIDSPVINGDLTLVSKETLLRTRLAASTAFGKTMAIYKSNERLSTLFLRLSKYLNDPFSTPRLLSSVIIDEYCISVSNSNQSINSDAIAKLLPILNTCLSDPDSNLPSFREFVPTLKGLRTQVLQLFSIFREQGRLSSSKIPQLAVLVKGEKDAGPDAFSVELAEKIINETFKKLLKSLSPVYKLSCIQSLEDIKHIIQMTILEAKESQNERCTSILSSYASASIKLAGLPIKLNPIIRSLMDSIKSEESFLLQERTSHSIVSLINQLNQNGKKGASDKMVKNLCAFFCVDTSEVPEFIPNKNYKDIILSLKKEESSVISNNISSKSSATNAATTNNNKNVAATAAAAAAATAAQQASESVLAEREIYLAKIKRRGSRLCLENLMNKYEDKLFEQIPRLKSTMLDPLNLLNTVDTNKSLTDSDGQSIIDALELIRSLMSNLDKSLYDSIINSLPILLKGLKSDYSIFRYSVAKCLGKIISILPSIGFQFYVKEILPMLNNPFELKQRQGGIECSYHLSNTMGSDILPYVVFLIVPIMGRMSDSNNDVRILAATTFASIIKLVPLEAGIPDPVDMPEDLMGSRDKERDFIQQMMDPTKIKPFELPVAIKATLRKYQQEGVNWLYFLNKYHLHGILCDDMGLGKTLQTICIVASDQYLRQVEFEKNQNVASRKLPSIIVCPPSLTGHWEQEFNQYSPSLKILVYAGSPSIRNSLRSQLDKVDVVVTSYDVVRNDVEIVSKIDYNYCVLDEGHIIKNANTKLTKSVKRLKSEHRLILSGTPIQNNVLELWSLFDFLMPGFLGTEKVFNEKFSKPITLSRTNKGEKEQEAGALALESLHKQVLPFLLRRLKEEVLSDLPPKIIQDYYCELSNLQKQLYKDFISKQKTSVANDLGDGEKGDSTGSSGGNGNGGGGKQHIFQVLQYMRKLCNHPALVITPKHPQFQDVTRYLKNYNMDIRDIHHAPKLIALKNLLLECGIGVGTNNSSLSNSSSHSSSNSNSLLGAGEEVISQHRVLIFCQMKDMLDMVENDLLKKVMPSVTYMRLDGSTEPRKRQEVVMKFNGDPSIDVLLLTTKVGGLGLNLTGADTVIFVEHDWNPMNDLQAMDRAHRLGQKKVVNVYRLITKDTLEEKIMGLQKFKMNIASTIINQQNSGLASMDTDQLLDLFNTDDNKFNGNTTDDNDNDNNDIKKSNGSGNGNGSNGIDNNSNSDVTDQSGIGGKAGAAVNELGDLWDESQYEEEYNLETFIKTLR